MRIHNTICFEGFPTDPFRSLACSRHDTSIGTIPGRLDITAGLTMSRLLVVLFAAAALLAAQRASAITISGAQARAFGARGDNAQGACCSAPLTCGVSRHRSAAPPRALPAVLHLAAPLIVHPRPALTLNRCHRRPPGTPQSFRVLAGFSPTSLSSSVSQLLHKPSPPGAQQHALSSPLAPTTPPPQTLRRATPAAWPDTQEGFSSICGRCFAVRCRPDTVANAPGAQQALGG